MNKYHIYAVFSILSSVFTAIFGIEEGYILFKLFFFTTSLFIIISSSIIFIKAKELQELDKERLKS